MRSHVPLHYLWMLLYDIHTKVATVRSRYSGTQTETLRILLLLKRLWRQRNCFVSVIVFLIPSFSNESFLTRIDPPFEFWSEILIIIYVVTVMGNESIHKLKIVKKNNSCKIIFYDTQRWDNPWKCKYFQIVILCLELCSWDMSLDECSRPAPVAVAW